MDYQKNVAGLYSARNRYRYPVDKRQSLPTDWAPMRVPLAQWVAWHRGGHALVSGEMRPIPHQLRGRRAYSHQEPLWQSTEWLALDLDDDRIDSRDAGSIHLINPDVDDLLFAVCESMSSRVDGNFARWHGFVLLEMPITTRQEYDALMWGLQGRLSTMTGAGRQPAHPCFGNARPDAYHVLLENVVCESMMRELMELGFQRDPTLRKPQVQARDRAHANAVGSRFITRELLTDYSGIEPKALQGFLSDFQVPVYAGKKTQGSRTLYYLPCPFAAEHTMQVAATDTYLSVEDDGRWGFGCFHNHCQKRIADAKRADAEASGWKLFADAVSCPVRMGLIQVGLEVPCVLHEKEARVYEGVPCPRHAEHRGIAVFRHEDKGRIFLCDEAACEPLGWQEFRQMHQRQEVAA